MTSDADRLDELEKGDRFRVDCHDETLRVHCAGPYGGPIVCDAYDEKGAQWPVAEVNGQLYLGWSQTTPADEQTRAKEIGSVTILDDCLRADGSGGTKYGEMIEGHEWDSPEDEGTGWRERTTGVADLEVTLHDEGYQTDRRWTVHVRRGHRDHPVAVYAAEHQNKGNFWREPDLWRDAVDFVELPLAVRKRVASMLNRPVDEITPEVRMVHREDGTGVGDRAGESSGTCEVCGGTLHDESDTHEACEAGDRHV